MAEFPNGNICDENYWSQRGTSWPCWGELTQTDVLISTSFSSTLQHSSQENGQSIKRKHTCPFQSAAQSIQTTASSPCHSPENRAVQRQSYLLESGHPNLWCSCFYCQNNPSKC